MKKLIISIVILIISLACNAQNVKQDAAGNYVSLSVENTARESGKTYTDAKGTTYPVMISKNGKLFVIRTSKAGNKYNQYLKL